MIETNIICDRCRKKVEGSTYYTIDICAHDINRDYGTSIETATHNTNRIAKGDTHLCSDCVSRVKILLNSNELDVFGL